MSSQFKDTKNRQKLQRNLRRKLNLIKIKLSRKRLRDLSQKMRRRKRRRDLRKSDDIKITLSAIMHTLLLP